MLEKKDFKVIKREYLVPLKKSIKSYDELIEEKKWKKKVVRLWDLEESLRIKIQKNRKTSKPLIYPVIMYYKQTDINESFPFYSFRINDVKRFCEYFDIEYNLK